MAFGALMAGDSTKQLSRQVLQNPQTIFSTTSHHHLSSSPSFSEPEANPTLPPADPDVAAAQQLVHLSSDGDADDATHVPANQDRPPREREELPTTTKATTATASEISKGDDSDCAPPTFAPRRKRRFASISSIYSRTKPLKVWVSRN